MEQETADDKREQSLQQRARMTRGQFWRLVAIVFVLHLIPVIGVLWGCMVENEAVMLWLLFFFLDFPLGFLYLVGAWMADPVFVWLGADRSMMNNVVFPAIFFQIVGTINWVIIVLFLRWLSRLWFRPLCNQKPL